MIRTKFTMFIFLTLITFAFSALGIALYNSCISDYNVFAVTAREVSGEYIISLPSSSSSNRTTLNGSAGRVPLNGSYCNINNAEKITGELNSLDGVKALPVGCRTSDYLVLINEKLNKIDPLIYRNKKKTELESILEKRDLKYSILKYDTIGDFTPDHIYGIESENLLEFYSGENSYEFTTVTGRKGAFFSEPLAEELGITEETETVSVFIPVGNSSNKVFNPQIIEVPVAGIFRIPFKRYYKEPDNDWQQTLGFNPDTKFIFLDIDYFSEISGKIDETVSADFDDGNIEDVLYRLEGASTTKSTTLGYQNIWVRGATEEQIQNIIAKYDEDLIVDNSFSSSVNLSRTYDTAKTTTLFAPVCIILNSLVIFGLFSFGFERFLDYYSREVTLLYALGKGRRQIERSLFLPLCIVSIPVTFISYIWGMFVRITKATYNTNVISPSDVLRNTHIIYLTVLIIALFISYMTCVRFVKKRTFNLMGKRSTV